MLTKGWTKVTKSLTPLQEILSSFLTCRTPGVNTLEAVTCNSGNHSFIILEFKLISSKDHYDDSRIPKESVRYGLVKFSASEEVKGIGCADFIYPKYCQRLTKQFESYKPPSITVLGVQN